MPWYNVLPNAPAMCQTFANVISANDPALSWLDARAVKSWLTTPGVTQSAFYFTSDIPYVELAILGRARNAGQAPELQIVSWLITDPLNPTPEEQQLVSTEVVAKIESWAQSVHGAPRQIRTLAPKVPPANLAALYVLLLNAVRSRIVHLTACGESTHYYIGL